MRDKGFGCIFCSHVFVCGDRYLYQGQSSCLDGGRAKIHFVEFSFVKCSSKRQNLKKKPLFYVSDKDKKKYIKFSISFLIVQY